jgi:toxin ParE1/3/4
MFVHPLWRGITIRFGMESASALLWITHPDSVEYTDSLEIRYLATAAKDLDVIFDYIMKDKPSAAASLIDEFDRSISRLSFNPGLGVIPKDDRLKNRGYRILIVRKYLVFYVVKGKVIQIRRILHGARQYSFLL